MFDTDKTMSDRVPEIKSEISALNETISILGNRVEKLRVQLSSVTRQEEAPTPPTAGACLGASMKLSTDLGKIIRDCRDNLDCIISNVNNISSRIEL